MKYKDCKQWLKEGMEIKSYSTCHPGAKGEFKLNHCEGSTCIGEIADSGHCFEDDETVEVFNPDGSKWHPPTFKVGDRVRIVKRKHGNSTGTEDYGKPNGDVGKTGVITAIYNKTHTVKDGKKYYGLFDSDDLEKIEDAESPQQLKPVSPDDFCKKCGMRVHRDNMVYSGELLGYVHDWCAIKTQSMTSNPFDKYVETITPLINMDNLKITLSNPKGNKMSLLKKIKLNFSKTDRTLQKHGYLDSEGERTSKFENEIWEDFKSEIIKERDTKDLRDKMAAELQDEEE